MPDKRPKQNASGMENAVAHGLGVLFWVAVWFAVAAFVGNDLLLAGPMDAFAALLRSLGEPSFWTATANTTARILAAGTLSSLAGIAIGALAHRFRLVKEAMFAPLQVMKSAPVACVIVIVLVAWGSAGALVTIVAFVAFPPFYVGMMQALEARPRQAETVLRLAGVSKVRVFVACIWPSALPFSVAASKTAVALSWRAGITAELLCLPMDSLGSAVYASKLTLDSGNLLALTIVVMVLSWACEKAVVALLQLSGKAARLAVRGGKGAKQGGLPENKADESFDGSSGPTEPSPFAGQTSSPTAPLNPEAAIVVEEVRKGYDGNKVLEGFALRVAPGERVCLMAPTGSGKSTAIAVMLGAAEADSGSVHAPERFGAMLQTESLVGGLTACENVLLEAGNGVTEQQVREALRELLPQDACDKEPCELSGGMKRLTEIVRAMLSDGQAIVLDEPFAGLDEESHRRACAFILENLHGRPLVVATHDRGDVDLLKARMVGIQAVRRPL